MPERLPVEDCLNDVIGALAANRPVILRAPPGAGKTTGVPRAVLASESLHAGSGTDAKILMLQPRRIAARAAVARLSHLDGSPLGATFGYHVRFDRNVSDQTRVISMTTGILLRRLMADPLLEDVACVILDEFHERSAELDLALGMLQRLRTTLREDLRLIVMSATLDTSSVEALLSDAVTIQSDGRAYEVAIRYDESLNTPSRLAKDIAQQVSKCLPGALRESDGDVLVFLPGVGEINRVADSIQAIARKQSATVQKLYGDLSAADQDAVLSPSPQRKIVLATNVAETSITIPGITCVIDSGLARTLQHDTATGIPSLQLGPISQASADQRAGRAGRTAPGVCYRLWPRAMDRSRPEHTKAEITCADLSSTLLTLASWGEREVDEFPWVTRPPEDAVAAARDQLIHLGAIDSSMRMTEIGKRMNQMPLHPRLARLMIAADQFGCTQQAAMAAALLSERDPFPRGTQWRSPACELESDLVARLERLQAYFGGASDDGILSGPAKNIRRVAQRLCQIANSQTAESDHQSGEDWKERLSRALVAAFPDRIAKRRERGSVSGKLVGGRGVKIDAASTVRTSELYLCINLDGKGKESLVRIASAVEESWLPDEWIVEENTVFFHPTLKSVVARKRKRFLDLVLAESPTECVPDEETGAMLFCEARSNINRVLPSKDNQLHRLIDRWRFLESMTDGANLPMSVDDALESVLRDLCHGRLSFKELSAAPWKEHLLGLLGYQQLDWFEQQAPEAIVVPSGSKIALEYPAGKPPVLAVRIQELFGWGDAPRLAEGAVRLQLHLLGPNHRPQQITDDLKSFWQTTYHEVRKELKRRYSKHHWPEDPATAVATRNGLKPRK